MYVPRPFVLYKFTWNKESLLFSKHLIDSREGDFILTDVHSFAF